MSGLIPQSFIDDLLNRTDIVDVVASRVSLKKTGKNYSACCPFHKEKTPSFSVSPDKQFYYCFGCGAGGNALGFVMDHDNLDFPTAVEELAKAAGMQVPREEGPRQAQKPRQAVDSPLYSILQAAAEYYASALKSHPARAAAVDYLKGRGLSGVIARDFNLGFAPPGWDGLYKHLGADELQQKAMLDAGLLIENEDSGKRYDRFRDRVMFPIRDSRGRVIAFGGRVLGDDKPKYLNSPETPVFHKGQELYGLYEARQANRNLDEIIVVEGYMDVIALAQQGLRNAVATLGTATSEEHLKRIFRLVPSVLFCFDGDAAGRKAAWRALESALPTLQDGRRARFLFLPDGEDPDSLVRKEGTEAFLLRIEKQSLPLADYFFQQLTEEADPRSLEGKAHLAMLARPLIDKIPGTNLRALMLKHLSDLTGLSEDALKAQPTQTPKIASDAPPFETELPPLDDYYFVAPNEPEAPYNERPRKEWKGKKRERTPRDTSPRVGVERPLLTALRTLLHYPEAAQRMMDAQHLAQEDDPYAQLLVALVSTLQKHPNMRTLQLIARWHGTEQGRLLRSLAEKEWLIDEANLEQQLFDTITTLEANQTFRRRENQVKELLQKSPSELTAEEKALIREHYSRPTIKGDA